MLPHADLVSQINETDEIQNLRIRYDELALKVCQMFDEDIDRDRTKKSKVIEWANTLETLMRKTGQEQDIHLICSYLTNHIRKQGLSKGYEFYIYECLKEFPHYKLNYPKYLEQQKRLKENGCRGLSSLSDLPEESSITNTKILDAFEIIRKMELKNMDRKQAALFTETLAEIKEDKVKEADDAGIAIYVSTFDELKENEENNEKYKTRISVPKPAGEKNNNGNGNGSNGNGGHGSTMAAQVTDTGSNSDYDTKMTTSEDMNPIQKRFLKISEIFRKMAEVEAENYPVLFKQAEDEICANLDAFIDFFIPTVDHKFRYSKADWTEITYGWDDMSTFAKERLYPQPSIFCKICKEHDYENDPYEMKGLQTPVMMHPIISPNRDDPDKPNYDPHLFVWQCPSCKGFDAINVEITRERAQDNLKMARVKLYEFINRFPLAVANILYFHEHIKRYRLGETVKMTPKLEHSK